MSKNHFSIRWVHGIQEMEISHAGWIISETLIYSSVVWVLFYSSVAFVSPLALRFLPLSPPPATWGAVSLDWALSVPAVMLRDAFWSAVDTDRPVRWDDSCKWRRAQTGTCNVTRLLHPSSTNTTALPAFPQPPTPPFRKINIHALDVDELRETFPLSLSGCDADMWWRTCCFCT